MSEQISKPIFLDETGQRIANSLEKLIEKTGTHKFTIVATSDDNVDIVNQTIEIYNANTNTLFSTVVYNSPTAITLNVPDGFSYLIKPKSTLEKHYCTDRPSGMVTEDTTITITYKSLGSLSTFMDLQGILDSGMGKYVELGTEVSFTHETYGNQIFEVVNYDSENDVFTLLNKNTISEDNFEFDASEALLKATAVMNPGNYTFKVNTTSYYFTLTKALPVGGQLKATTNEFFTYESPYETSYLEKGTVSTDVLDSAIDLGTTGKGVLNHWDRVQYGSNDYGESAIDQWLNGTGIDWWTAKTMFDRPTSYKNKKGFLDGVPKDVLNAIANTEVKCGSQNVYCAPDSNHTKNSKYTLNRKFYLASEMEVFGTTIVDDGSKQFQLYIDATNADRIKYYNSSASSWWLRSPSSNAYNERYVDPSGVVTNGGAYVGRGAVAACQITKSSS